MIPDKLPEGERGKISLLLGFWLIISDKFDTESIFYGERVMNKHLLAIITSALLLTACSSTAPDAASPPGVTAEADSPQIEDIDPAALISEVLTGAPGNNNLEFIELYNAGNKAPVDLRGWSLWYMLAEGQDARLVYRWSEHALIPPQGHYLLGRAGEDVGVVADSVFEQSLAHQKGILQLRAADGTVVDSLSWGDGAATSANVIENGVSLERFPGGDAGNMLDSGDNSTDFGFNPQPDPQNTGSAVTPMAQMC